jgi:hypothetical protein
LVLWSLSVSMTSDCSTSSILVLDLGLQLVELAVLDEVGDVVVGVVAAVGPDKAVADALRCGHAVQSLSSGDRGGVLAQGSSVGGRA